jgi:2-amino-4-hydroxy-6-hydroxymethyldihydropteridine diphosphokinase
VTATGIELPPWSIASSRRRAHIARVVALVDAWSAAMRVDRAERDAWRDAASWHDALRDASEPELRALVPALAWPANALHGPAAAARLAADGETRDDVLDAIRWHTVGSARFGRAGRALYMADYLEPGRKFDREWRAEMASHVPVDFDAAFREVARHRIAPRVAEGEALLPETEALWRSVR